jgi:adenine-specific DNA-methyltransferase
VSLHVHERIDPRRIIEAVRKEAETRPVGSVPLHQPSLFEAEKKPLREAIEFYKHREGWSNRLIAGDSLLVMNSLLEKEGMGAKVQMIYFDPPYGIKYGSNFQPFVNKRDVKDGRDEDLTAEPEMIKAFRDTWELGIHSYLTYLRDRLLLAKELLRESGSIFVQISDENQHLIRNLLDEVFGVNSFIVMVAVQKTGSQTGGFVQGNCDYVLWYAKDRPLANNSFRKLFLQRRLRSAGGTGYTMVELLDGSDRSLTDDEVADLKLLPEGSRIWRAYPLTSDGFRDTTTVTFTYNGQDYFPGANRHWGVTVDDLQRVADVGRIIALGGQIHLKRYFDDFPVIPVSSYWDDMGGAANRIYVVQTNARAIERCLLMTTDPGDLVLDITCGSGTTAYVAENWGRRWITCDTSRVAAALAKQRLMTADFDYFELAHPDEGVGSGFKYKTVPHITLKSIANNEPSPQETLYDQPFVDNKKLRVTGPFTVEAVPAPYAKSPDEDVATGDATQEAGADVSIARSGETLRQSEWIDRLKDGVRGKGGAIIEFTRVEPLGGTHFLQAEAETRPVGSVPGDHPKRVVVCFGPEHAPMEQRLVEQALAEANSLMPKPEIILFCAFQFDPEARKDIDETNWPGIQLLEAQMDSDLQTDDLKKKPRDKTNPAFWLIGQPDVSGQWSVVSGQQDRMYTVTVHGFDYYNPKTGQVESGGRGDIAMWMLDPDYDDRSLFPTQVFFPMAGDKDGWSKLARNLKAEIDEEKIEAFRGTVSLPFKPGRKVAVKIIDARGIESLKIIHIQ